MNLLLTSMAVLSQSMGLVHKLNCNRIYLLVVDAHTVHMGLFAAEGILLGPIKTRQPQAALLALGRKRPRLRSTRLRALRLYES
jgi:hypothetical protein